MLDDSSFSKLATKMDTVLELARSSTTPLSPAQSETGFDIVTARLAARQWRQRRNQRLIFAGLSATAVVALGLYLAHPHHSVVRESPLGYVIEGGQIVDGGYLRATDPTGVRVRFAEGTEVQLPAETRGRLRSVDAKGARFAIEQGFATVQVTPRPEALWQLDAGPFLITVHGTTFTVFWDGASGHLDVRMETGLVSVKGPLSEEPIKVRAGQRLAINLKKREVLLQEMEAVSAEPAAPARKSPAILESAPQLPAPPAERPQEHPPSSPRTGMGPTAQSWSAALASGDMDFILADAERRGISQTMAHASSDALAALADAARYRRKDELACMALLAQRERFPGSRRAGEAAFLLGRLEETDARGGAKAIDWYDRYLAEAPSGSYASEAMGRKMVAIRRLQGAPAARALAETYLRRFPGGIYAGAARALLDSP